MDQRGAGIRGGAGIFHSAGDKVIDHHLRVFFPGIVDAKSFIEKLDHGRSSSVIDGQAVAAAFRRIVGDRQPVETVFDFVEFTGDDGNEVSGAGKGFAPRPGLHIVGSVGDADQFSIADGKPRSGNGEDGLGGQAVVGIVITGEGNSGCLRLRPETRFGAGDWA